jgi:hypothetical protein
MVSAQNYPNHVKYDSQNEVFKVHQMLITIFKTVKLSNDIQSDDHVSVIQVRLQVPHDSLNIVYTR